MDTDLTPEQKQFKGDAFTYPKSKVLPEMEEELFVNIEGDVKDYKLKTLNEYFGFPSFPHSL